MYFLLIKCTFVTYKNISHCGIDKKAPIKFHEASLPIISDKVQEKIAHIRQWNVITDADVAELYGVETKRVNEAFRNNPDKFPEDYMFTLTKEELQDLRSKISSTKVSPKSRTMPKVFTEKGLYMLATILKSKRAVDVTFAIIETFAKVRYLKREIVELHKGKRPEIQTEKMKRFGEVISDIVMPDLRCQVGKPNFSIRTLHPNGNLPDIIQ